MFSDFISLSILISSISAFIPIAIMMRYKSALMQRSYGLAILGYLATLCVMGVFGFLFSFLYQSSFPAYHIFIWPIAFFIFLLFKNEYQNIKYKRLAYLFLSIGLFSEVIEFILKGGFFTNNTVTYSIINITFIAHYILYVIDTFKNNPNIIFDKKGPFMFMSATFIYSINQVLFTFIEEDIRYILDTNEYAVLIWSMFVWLYTFYLYFVSFFLWKNLRS
jgi:hypothetical protein